MLPGRGVVVDGRRMETPPSVLLARSAMLRGFQAEAKTLGLNAEALAAEAGVERAALVNPDLLAPAQAMAAMYETAAERSGADDFALRVIARRRISNLGLLGLLAREEPTVRQALRSIQRYMWTQNEALELTVDEFDDHVLLRAAPLIAQRRQIADLCVGMFLIVIRYLIGEIWKPEEIYLPYSPPQRLGRYYQAFGMKPRFDQDLAGILMTKADLETRIAMADPDFVSRLRQQLEEATSNRKSGFIVGVRALIARRLANADFGIDQIAADLGLSRRSLQRQLAEHGASFTDLVDLTRRSLVPSLLLDSDRSVERVADLLGFAQASAFSVWFKQRFDCPPTVYRSRKGAGPAPP